MYGILTTTKQRGHCTCRKTAVGRGLQGNRIVDVCVVWIQVSSTEPTNKARKCRAFGILGHTECEQQHNFQD